MQCTGIKPHFPARGMSDGFLELRQVPGIYPRVTVGIAIRKSTLFSEVWTPV